MINLCYEITTIYEITTMYEITIILMKIGQSGPSDIHFNPREPAIISSHQSVFIQCSVKLFVTDHGGNYGLVC